MLLTVHTLILTFNSIERIWIFDLHSYLSDLVLGLNRSAQYYNLKYLYNISNGLNEGL